MMNIVKQIKLRKYIRGHKKTADFFAPLISRYLSGEIKKWHFEPKKDLRGKKVIWQYWGQGVEDWSSLPDIVQLCFESVDRYAGEYQVIRLSDDTVGDYIDFPDFVYDKLHNNSHFTRTFFSDLLRVSLLSTYGGVWLDATILLTDHLPVEYTVMEYFMYQRSDDEAYKSFFENDFPAYYGWRKEFKVRSLNSVIFAQPANVVVSAIQDLLLYYWEHESKILNYFFFQILYNELIEGAYSQFMCPVVSDCIPHYVQAKIYSQFRYLTYEEVLSLTSIHKLSYFNKEEMARLRQGLDQKNINI